MTGALNLSCGTMKLDEGTIPQVVYYSDIRYIPKSISVSMSVRSTGNLSQVLKHIMTSQSESPCLVVARIYEYLFSFFISKNMPQFFSVQTTNLIKKKSILSKNKL